MNWFLEYWYLVLAAMVLIVTIVLAIINFFRLPAGERREKICQWLLWAVTEAEAELGKNTGRLKLSLVYDRFIGRFGWLGKLISFTYFCSLVDSALEEMRKMLTSNQEVKDIVYGTESKSE